MQQLHYACTELKDKNEIAIIYKYGCDAKRYATILTSKYSLCIILTSFQDIFHLTYFL